MRVHTEMLSRREKVKKKKKSKRSTNQTVTTTAPADIVTFRGIERTVLLSGFQANEGVAISIEKQISRPACPNGCNQKWMMRLYNRRVRSGKKHNKYLPWAWLCLRCKHLEVDASVPSQYIFLADRQQ